MEEVKEINIKSNIEELYLLRAALLEKESTKVATLCMEGMKNLKIIEGIEKSIIKYNEKNQKNDQTQV